MDSLDEFERLETEVVRRARDCVAVLGVGHRLIKKAAAHRHDVDYRADAVGFSLALLLWHASDSDRKADGTLPGQPAQHELLHRASREQRFLFDNLVFNACSLFDYTGAFVGFLLHQDHNSKYRWMNRGGLEKLARHSSPPLWIQDSKAGDFIASQTDEWVKKLFEARSTVIHDRTERGDGTFTFRLSRDADAKLVSRADIEIILPRSLAPVVGERPATLGRVSLPEAGKTLAMRTFQTVAETLRLAREDLEARPSRPPTAPS